MDSSLNRWLVSGLWMAAIAALVSAATQGALSVAIWWSLPVALIGTFAAMAFTGKPMARIVAGLGVVWQLALIGTYWPFASKTDPNEVLGPMHWPVQSLVIGAVLLLLVLTFLSLFLVPIIGLCLRLSRASRAAASETPDVADAIGAQLEQDASLGQLWVDWRAQARLQHEVKAVDEAGSAVSARDWFDISSIANARLRLEFIRNLPGVFTGLGIIGTFTGLILGLRRFKISQDPAVIQQSLESLLSGVWEAFMISALAITIAITITVIEKLAMSVLARRLEDFTLALDRLFPPRQAQDALPWMQRLSDHFSASRAAGERRPAAVAVPAAEISAPHAAPMAMQPMSAFEPVRSPYGDAGAPAPQHAHAAPMPSAGAAQPTPGMPVTDLQPLLDIAGAARASAQAVGEIAARLPTAMAEQLAAVTQSNQQSAQLLKTLSGRLEGVASSIEVSGRRTLETVAARLMQSEMNMVSRHHAVAEHLGELVQRIEALCGLLQQDRADHMRDDGGGLHGGMGGFHPMDGGEPARPGPWRQPHAQAGGGHGLDGRHQGWQGGNLGGNNFNGEFNGNFNGNFNGDASPFGNAAPSLGYGTDEEIWGEPQGGGFKP